MALDWPALSTTIDEDSVDVAEFVVDVSYRLLELPKRCSIDLPRSGYVLIDLLFLTGDEPVAHKEPAVVR